MFPQRSEWKSWSTLERITYLAQLAAALALLPTVVFAYLSLREARLAREDQARFFLAEKAPNLEVSSIKVASGLLMIEFANTGESVAKDIRVKLHVVGSRSDPNGLASIPILEILEGKPFSIQKSQKTALPVQSNIELEKVLGFIPSEIQILDAMTVVKADPIHPVLWISAEYTDFRGQPRLNWTTAKIVK